MPETKEPELEPRALGEHIRKRRLELGLTQKEAAKRLGCCWSAVLNWEKGKRQSPVKFMPAILSFLRYDPFSQPKTLSERMLALRRANGWTIKQTARQLGIDEETWGRWER